MKLLFLFCALILSAQEKQSIWDFHPIHAGGNVIYIGKADVVPKHESKQGTLSFNKENVFVNVFLPINKCNFFSPRIEWNTFLVDWNQNPKFDQKRYQFIQFALSFISIALEKWRWITRVEYNMDTAHFFDPQHYSLFSALLWGKYQLSCNWNFHIGAMGYRGYKGQEVYPIIGIDYAYNKTWYVQAVFPILYSIEYAFNKEWRLAIKGRPLKERFRTGDEEPQPKSVFSYSSFGAELNLRFERFLRAEAEAFVGYNFGGDFYIKNRSGHKPLYTHVHGAPYIGATFNWGF